MTYRFVSFLFFVCTRCTELIWTALSYNFNKFDAQSGAQTNVTQTPGSTSASASAHVTMVGSYENIFGYVYCMLPTLLL